MFEPRKLSPFSIEYCNAPIAVMTEMTENTPIVMPSIVSRERSLFAPRDDHAILMISPNSILFTAEGAEFAEQNHKVASSLSPSTRRRIDCFDLNKDGLIHDDVCPVSAVE